MRLLSVELRRYFSRWTIRIGWVGAMVLIAILGAGTYLSSAPPTAEEIAEAEHYFEQDHAEWVKSGDEWEAGCREDEANEREALIEAGDEAGAAELNFGCDEMEPKLEHYMWSTTYQEDVKSSLFTGGAFIVLPLVLGMAITFMASEFTTGTMSTWLTFEPRRQRVYASKLGAVAVASGLLSALTYGVLWLIYLGITTAYDLEPLVGEGYQYMVDTSFGHVVVRVALLVIAAGLFGVALSSIIRHTAGAIIAVVGYVIIDKIAQGIYAPLAKYALTTHVQGVVLNGATYYVDVCESVAGGTSCQFTEYSIDFEISAIVIAVLVLGTVVVGAWRFQRRDVS